VARGGRLGLWAAGLLLALTGCVKADVNLTVRADDQVDGRIVMAVDRSFISPGDGSQAALVSALSRAVFSGTPAGAHQETYADPRYVGTLVPGPSTRLRWRPARRRAPRMRKECRTASTCSSGSRFRAASSAATGRWTATP
jgi:hypothetical protein